MEINNKSIKGIFLYQDNIQFEKGDFVIEKDIIYTVIANVINISPSKDTSKSYYSIYLGGLTANENDFVEYAKGNDIDKLITSRSIDKILNIYMKGFNEKGLITNKINKDRTIYIRDYCNNISDINPEESYENPLDKILVSPSINNGVFIVDREIVNTILGKSEIVDENKPNEVILRQYTYSTSDDYKDIYVRIQELVDASDGTVKYRYSKSSDDNLNSFAPNSWKSTYIPTGIKSKVDSIIAYYNSEINSYKLLKQNLADQFCFKSIDPIETTTVGLYNIKVPIDPELEAANLEDIQKIITITTYKIVDSSGLRLVKSTTINLNDLMTGSIKVNAVSGTIEISKKEESMLILGDNESFNLKFSDPSVKIDNIYGRKTAKLNN